ncbi:MAG: hypothetical protein OEZ22_03860 [Spirochaetia bacterium]|nr:hypothetical protein [Spirochaetia bacterium]
MLKKIKQIFIIYLAVFSCINSDEEPLVDTLGTKSFWAVDVFNAENEYYQVQAIFAGETEHAIAYVEVTSDVDIEKVEDVLHTFENHIIKVINPVFGEPYYIGTEKKITFLFLDIKDGFETIEDPFFGGYFNPMNYVLDADAIKYADGARSNERAMLYLDTYPTVLGSKFLLSVLTHEYQHLLNFSEDYRAYNRGIDNFEEVWVNEGMSQVASDIAGYGPQIDKLFEFENTAGNSLIKWDDNLTDYANAYVYFRYLYDIYGSNIFYEITSSGFAGIEGVNNALQSMQDVNLIDYCSNVYHLTYPEFDCSYRFLYASLYNLNSAGLTVQSGSTSSSTNFLQVPLGYEFSLKTNEFFLKPLAGAVSNKYIEPYSFVPLVKQAGTSPSISGAGVYNFTQMYHADDSNFIIYNHDHNPEAGASFVSISASQSSELTLNKLQASSDEKSQLKEKLKKTSSSYNARYLHIPINKKLLKNNR